jgi:hypothetical protein
MPEGRGCYWQGQLYSNGSEVCQAGVLKECVDGEWRTRGICATSDQGSTGDVSKLLEDIPPASEREAAEYAAAIRERQQPEAIRPLDITMYAEWWSIRRDNQWLYFRGGPTPGHVCSGDLQSYQWHLENVIRMGPQQRCRTNPGTLYREITATAP